MSSTIVETCVEGLFTVRDPDKMLSMAVTIEDVLRFCSRFDRTVQALTKRGHNKPPFAFTDEYDVQDVAFAALKPLVDDLTTEDPTPKVAGLPGRVDLVSYQLGLAIEAKATLAASRDPKDIVKECFERVQKYSSVRGIRVLAFFIYDPEQKIVDRDNVQRGLETSHTAIDGGTYVVRVVGPGFKQTFEKSEPASTAPVKPRRERIADNDAINELSSWFYALPDHKRREIVRFAPLDELLDLPDGTAKKLMVQAVSKHYEVSVIGDDTATFKYRERRESQISFGPRKRGVY